MSCFHCMTEGYCQARHTLKEGARNVHLAPAEAAHCHYIHRRASAPTLYEDECSYPFGQQQQSQ
eukprot:scaffold81590_cov25-Prasinocladus_malaysianus.AAC.1